MSTRHLCKDTGETINEYLKIFIRDIEGDDIGVGLVDFVGDAREQFDLTVAELVDFVERAMVTVLAWGATAKVENPAAPQGDLLDVHFGRDTPEEIARGLTAEWVRRGMPEPDFFTIRFNTPENWAEIARRCVERDAETAAWKAERAARAKTPDGDR